MDIKGYYINLDRSTDRRAAFEAQLRRQGMLEVFERFSAVDGNQAERRATSLTAGELGCFASHCQVLERAAATGGWTLVAEDDVVLSAITFRTLAELIRRGVAEKYDQLLTDVTIPVGLAYLRSFKELFDSNVVCDAEGRIERIRNFAVLDLAGNWFSGATCYLVNGRSATRLAGLLRHEIEIGPSKPVDLFIQERIGEGSLRAGVVFPFLTSVSLETNLAPTIAGRGHDNVALLATSIIRNSFFVGRDLRVCEDVLNQAQPRRRPDRHQRLLEGVLAYVLAGEVKP